MGNIKKKGSDALLLKYVRQNFCSDGQCEVAQIFAAHILT